MKGYQTRSSLFDEVFNNFFGCEFDSLFDSTSNNKSYVYSKSSYTDSCGNRVTCVNDNGKISTVRNLVNNKLPQALVSGTVIPYTDIFIDKDQNMVIEMSMAGIDEDRIGVTFEDDTLKVMIAETEDDKYKDRLYIQNAIKDTAGGFHREIYIDPAKFDVDSLEDPNNFEYKNGIFTITVKKNANVKGPRTFRIPVKKSAEIELKKDEE